MVRTAAFATSFDGQLKLLPLNNFYYLIEARVEYEILNGYTTGEPYDYGSVLHYGSFFFSLDPKIPTIVKLMPGGPKIGQRRGFSDLDLRKISKLYECKNYISKWTINLTLFLRLVDNWFGTVCNCFEP